MTGAALAVAAGYGAFLLYTAVAFGWHGVGVAPRLRGPGRHRPWLEESLARAGLDNVRPSEFLAVVGVLFVVGAGLGMAIFDGAVAALALGAFAASAPVGAHRARAQRRRDEAAAEWPRLVEEIRLLTGSLGRSIPQALFEVGGRAPDQLRASFATAQREWAISTDFERSIGVLKARLADPTADAACETLLVAHQVGGTNVERRLAELVEDRIADVNGRKDARAKQAGVRFARRFTLIVPFGMALAGLSIGNGRAAYRTHLGQLAAALGIALTVLCWLWAGRILRLPEEERVFGD